MPIRSTCHWSLVPALFMVPQLVLSAELHQQPHLRRPVAIVADTTSVVVANRHGSLSTIDSATHQVVREEQVGTKLADLDWVPGSPFLLAVDEGADQLLVIRQKAGGLAVDRSVELPTSPVDLCLFDGGHGGSVTSLWSRQLTLLSFEAKADDSLRARVVEKIDLPFAPRKQIQVDDDHLVVADAFGGHLAVVDLQQRAVTAVHTFAGHNVRGMAISPNGRELLVTHQVLDGKMSTTHENIFWGGLMSNVLRSFPIKAVLEADAGQDVSGYAYPLGRPSNGTGDPADVLVTARGETIISLSGVDEIAFRVRPLEPFVRRYVGRLPRALAASVDGRRVYIANMLEDSISVLDLSDLRVTTTISLGEQPTPSDVERGESLFYDARLSLDGWFSCHSCHTDGHTNGLLNDNFSDGHFGAPKRILSLHGAADTGPWAWNGGVAKLESQVRNSIEKTMLGSDVTVEQVRQLTAFVQRLEPVPIREDLEATAVGRGRRIFHQRQCVKCHVPPTFTSADAYDVGFEDEQGSTQFNPPSLRGVGQRGPFFHDNRAKTLRDVFLEFGHGHESEVDPAEVEDLLAFLRSL